MHYTGTLPCKTSIHISIHSQFLSENRRCVSMLMLCRLSSPPRLLSPLRHFSSSPSPSPSSSSRLRWLNPPYRRRIKSFATAAEAVEVADKKGSDTFLADDSVSWTSLGVSDRLSRSLSSIGLERPSLVQASCIPCILSGNDVVIAAETGSGKTHGYLVPLMNKLCTMPDNSVNSTAESVSSLPHRLSLVLCPNVMLCEQVVRMANCLSDDNGEPFLRVAAVCGRQGWPVDEPDIIVSTPVALLNYLYAIDPDKRRRSDFIRGVKYVVFDEADMLICGSFQNQVIRLINMLRFDEKMLSRTKILSVVGTSVDSCSDSIADVEFQDDKDLQADFMLREEEGDESGTDVEDFTEGIDAEDTKRKDWRRVRKNYERSKQYIFVAATLPVNGKKTAGGLLKRMFPDASWVSGHYLHHHNPRLEQKWIEVTVDTQVDVLIDSVKKGFKSKELNYGDGLSRTMVFVNTVEAVEAVATILVRSGIECFRYHRDTSLEERTKNLVDFQQKGGILVCTDAAARGLDVPNVSHVIQAESRLEYCGPGFAIRVAMVVVTWAEDAMQCDLRSGLTMRRLSELNPWIYGALQAKILALLLAVAVAKKGRGRKSLCVFSFILGRIENLLGLLVTSCRAARAEFAMSAVDFLHRVGRTARAGQPGLVTSLYTESNRDLVAAVRQAGTFDQPVEKAFSRKRSFRKKLKK
ncbi:DEA(D/H)-box RNA helicase family protein [Actinidia rufa]|uniref:RNA helicase n=1 Tax=Actinidia rufa TaxID=165716 RepID=A0A7J0EPB0_9ERIC|nr:DEA(D/H)-box RNA helicase family protein [Actinidia rufa]